MKKIIPLCFFCLSATILFAQKETFDLVTYTPPKAWKKQPAESAIQFSIEDAAKGTYCLITLYKAVPGTPVSKENFDMAWESLVKEMVTVSTAPEMLPSETEDGWEIASGHASFEIDGNKGVVILATSTGFEKMVNIIILTNTDEYEKNVTDFLESINFEKQSPAANTPVTNPVKPEQGNTVAKKDGFTFTSTKFDDGWTSTVQEDWVQTTKGNIKVLIHYPNKIADEYSTDLLDRLKKAWDILIAPKYSSATNMEFKPLHSWQSIEFAEADMVEKATGKSVHVVFFKKNFSGGSGKFLEFITPDKNSFEKEFGTYNNEASADSWDKMAAMANYNKFAVAASDLRGKWTNNFTGMTQYVNIYTGADAGATAHSSNQIFEFGAGNTYKWSISVANGFVGNMKFDGAKSNGKFSVPNNWQVYFSEIERKAKTYNAYFSCIRDARILWLEDTGYPTGYTGYGKANN